MLSDLKLVYLGWPAPPSSEVRSPLAVTSSVVSSILLIAVSSLSSRAMSVVFLVEHSGPRTAAPGTHQALSKRMQSECVHPCSPGDL